MLATVKGDVHDIGKNIVGIVLACNNFEVIDMGVMVPCDKILAKAREVKADIIGLSGLITPSLDEMMHVASEMERLGMKTPLLIGGATTSAAHTAIKIAPKYSGSIVHVLDASRSVPVATALLSDNQREEFVAENEARHIRLKDQFNNKQQKPVLSLEAARANAVKTDWATVEIAKPAFLGTRVIADQSLRELATYIDWTPFFHSWELRGVWVYGENYFKSSNPEVVEQAMKLHADALEWLERIIAEKRFTARGVYGFFPANSVGDDIEIYTDETRSKVSHTLHTLRQQIQKSGNEQNKPNEALSDYVAPRGGGFQPPTVPDATDADALLSAFRIPDSFKAYHTELPTRRTRTGNLPHWTFEGGTYAVTFRTADSIPAAVVADYLEQKANLKAQIESAASEEERNALELDLKDLYSAKIESVLDQHQGQCVLRRADCAEIVCNALRHFEGDRYQLHAWCVMPNHVHVIFTPLSGNEPSDILHSWKRHSALQINKLLGQSGEFWQKESYDHLLRDSEEFAVMAKYVIRNPEASGISNWPWRGVAQDTRRLETAATADYCGGFVLGIHGADEFAEELKREHDDYGSIMVKAIADRFAEAFAELLHHRARVEWGYERPNEFNAEQLIKENYRGIRPAPGYPSQPDHTEKEVLFSMLQATEKTGVTLTESMAMHPGSAVSGLYFSHPESHYFMISDLQKDQIEDYATRKGMTVAAAEKWLAPWLGYSS